MKILENIPYVLAAIILVSMIFFIIFGEHGLRDLNKIRYEVEQLKVINEKLKKENQKMKRLVTRLENKDPALYEQIAREQLEMVKKDDIIIIREENPQNYKDDKK